MRKIILTLLVLGAGLSAIAQNTYGLDAGNPRADKRQKAMSAWHKDMADFRSRSMEERQLNDLADSLASVQARAALLNRDFVLEATSVTFKNGSTAFINSTTNFIYLKGDKAVVQISPSNFASGPNGLGGVTVDGMISSPEMRVDKHGNMTYSFGVTGIGINAQIERCCAPCENVISKEEYKKRIDSACEFLEGNTEKIKKELETEMLEKINALGIGPQGFGGRTTAIAVNIETLPTHIAGMPCAININCHVTRHKTEVL